MNVKRSAWTGYTYIILKQETDPKYHGFYRCLVQMSSGDWYLYLENIADLTSMTDVPEDEHVTLLQQALAWTIANINEKVAIQAEIYRLITGEST